MRKLLRLSRAVALAGGLAAVSAFGSLPPARTAVAVPMAAPAAPIDLGDEIAAFYLDRGFRPLWAEGTALRPEAHRLLDLLENSGKVEPRLRQAIAAARSGERHALARADLLLTAGFADLVFDLHRPPTASAMRYVDDGLAPAEPGVRARLEEAAAAPSLADHLSEVSRVNPALDGLRRGRALYRKRWGRLPQVAIPDGPAIRPGETGERPTLLRRRLGLAPDVAASDLSARLREFQHVHGLEATGTADPATVAALNRGPGHYERLIVANMERARAIPARRGRYLLVDTASARLWLVEDGRLTGGMRVIVGKQGMQTPEMAGLIDHAVLNPYWNLPPDLIRDRARKALRRGHRVIAAERLQVLSDWSPRARTLSPARVNWREVASGRRYVNLRQRPGPHNMMGAIKFMMPNDLGIYLHDTPLRHYFARDDRRISSGCVRLEDAPRVARWLFGGAPPRPNGTAEQRVDLPEPVPVYITYLTAIPTREGVRFQPDRYGRDAAWLARLERTAPSEIA